MRKRPPVRKAIRRNLRQFTSEFHRELFDRCWDDDLEFLASVDPPISVEDQTIVDDVERNLLMIACLCGHVDIVKFLLDLGFDPNFINGRRDTPLQYACRGHFESVDIVYLLLERGAIIDLRNSQWETPLYSACQRGALGIACLLIGRGANPLLGDRRRKLPIALVD